MKETIRNYLETILAERDWSWTLVAILFILLGLVIRGWFLKPLVRKAKELDRALYHEIKAAYLRRSLWGWISFLLSVGLTILLWNEGTAFPFSLRDLAIVIGILSSLILSVLLHLVAFGLATLSVLKEAENRQKPF